MELIGKPFSKAIENGIKLHIVETIIHRDKIYYLLSIATSNKISNLLKVKRELAITSL